MNEVAAELPQNVLTLPQKARIKQPSVLKQRFRVIPFTNPSGVKVWNVTGIKRDGVRVRENYQSIEAAQCRQIELEAEYQARQQTDSNLRATTLSENQIRIAEVSFSRLDSDEDMFQAVENWLKRGRHESVAESPRLDDAVTQFKSWLEGVPLRPRTKSNLRVRVSAFSNSVQNLRIADITPEVLDGYLDKRQVSASSKDNDRRAISRFFSWCMDRKRRWTMVNPCHAVKVEQGEKSPPAVLSVDECARLLKAAERFKRGRLAPYVALCLFGGLRPFEASRVTWKQINAADGEIRLEGQQTKTGTPRVVAICPTLKAWLQSYKGRELYPANWRKDFDALKEQIGYGPESKPWPEDVLRHTAISHYFRQTGSYGQTAEQFGNSEAIIKRHYQGRVSSQDTKRFFALRPRKS